MFSSQPFINSNLNPWIINTVLTSLNSQSQNHYRWLSQPAQSSHKLGPHGIHAVQQASMNSLGGH